jgi:exonuclease SbcC
LTGDLKGQRIRVAERASAAPTDLVLADAREDLARQLDELKTVLSLVNTEDAVRARRIDAEAALDTAKSAFGTAQKASSEAENRLTALKAELEARLKDVPAELRGEQALVAATGKSAKRLKDALAFHDAAGVARQEAARDRDTKAALAKASEALVEKAIARVAEEDLLLKRALDQYGFDDEDAFKAARREEREMDTLRADIETFHKDKAAAEDRLKRATGEVDGKDRPDVTALDKTHADAKASVGEARDLKSKLQSDQAYLLDARRRYTEKTEEFECLDQVYREAALLGDVADGRGANVKRTPLVEYVLQTYFDDVLRHANARFRRMSQERFVLRRKQVASGGRGTAGLDITVFDTFTDQERDAATLSGGESFLAALSLALGLSDVVQAEAGGIRLDAIFIDEGFGHLDEEALDKALETLVDLGGGARSVGIISHVEEVKRMVPVGFDVVRAARGSEIRVRPGG